MSEETAGAAATPPRPVILIVDDSDDIRALLGTLLKKFYEVRLAANGRQALQLAAQTPQPHLILIDVEMPGGNGYEVCKRLKDTRSRAASR